MNTIATRRRWRTVVQQQCGCGAGPLIRNQFGGQLGGPIKKDKAFFYFDFYDSRIIQSAPEAPTVPLDSYRNGNVSYILATPSSGTQYVLLYEQGKHHSVVRRDVDVRAGEGLRSRKNVGFSPVVQSFLNSRYPHANDLTCGDGINTGGFRFNAPDPTYETNYVSKIDYTLNQTMKLFGRVAINRENATEFPNSFPGDPVSNPFIDRSYSYVISHTWTIGSSKVNQFTYGDTVEKFNFPNTYDPTGTTVLGLGEGLGDPYETQQAQKRRIPIPIVRDDFTWSKGSHNIGFGGTFKFIKTESQQIYDFNFLTVGLGGATYEPECELCAHPTSGAARLRLGFMTVHLRLHWDVLAGADELQLHLRGHALPNGTGHIRRYRYYQTELYVGDTWKATKEPDPDLRSALSVLFGALRGERRGVDYELQLRQVFCGPGYAERGRPVRGLGGTVYYVQSGRQGEQRSAAVPADYKDFAPRLSFAYNPHWSSKTVFNGGVGIVYDRTVMNALNFLQDQSSYLFQNSVATSYGNASANVALATDPRVGTNFAYTNPNVAPTITKPFTPFVSGGSPYGLFDQEVNFSIDSNIKDPYSIQLDAGVQRSLPGNMVLKVSYVGRLGRRLLGLQTRRK